MKVGAALGSAYASIYPCKTHLECHMGIEPFPAGIAKTFKIRQASASQNVQNRDFN